MSAFELGVLKTELEPETFQAIAHIAVAMIDVFEAATHEMDTVKDTDRLNDAVVHLEYLIEPVVRREQQNKTNSNALIEHMNKAVGS